MSAALGNGFRRFVARRGGAMAEVQSRRAEGACRFPQQLASPQGSSARSVSR